MYLGTFGILGSLGFLPAVASARAGNVRYTAAMWPFRRKRKKLSCMDKLIAGVIIGGAIGSIVGKKLLERKQEEHDEKENEGKEEEEKTE